MGWFNKKDNAPAPPPTDAGRAPRRPSDSASSPGTFVGLPVPQDPHLAPVVQLLNAHAAVIKTTNPQIRSALRNIARAGGAPSFTEYTEDLITGRPSRTDAPWEWLLDAARRAGASGYPQIVAAIGQFADFVHPNGANVDSPVDLADVHLWPMSPRMLVPFTDVVLPAVESLPTDWRLFDGSGDSIDRSGLLLLWSLTEQELVGVSPEASSIATRIRAERDLDVRGHADLRTLTRVVLAQDRRRSDAESADRSRGFDGCRDYAAGLSALARDDNPAALAPLLAAASAGHSHAAYHGGFVAQDAGDVALMLQLWEQAARGGVAAAAFNLAIELEDRGQSERARTWFEQAGHLGDDKGYAMLAVLSADDPLARRKWARLGADQGNAVCMGQLAACLFEDAQRGDGPPDDRVISQARHWGERGGRLGSETAMFFAGAIAALQGDRDVAREWLVKAHQAGHSNALAFLRRFDL